jgi:hypothetical protein
MSPAHETPAADEDRPAPPAERPAFSLFSWMRREPGPQPAAPPDAESAGGPGKPDPLE